MADKARFARLIDERLRVLDRPAAWLAREVGVSEVNISRWRDDTRPTMPRDPATAHALAAALAMSELQKQAFFEAAGLVYRPSAPPPPAFAAPQLDPAHVAAYLAVMRSECGRAETRPYLNRPADLRGAPAHLTLLAEGEQEGVYVPLRFDLHPSRPELEMPGELAGRGKRTEKAALRDLARGDISLHDVLASPGHVVFIGAAGCGKTTILRVVAATLAAADTDLASKELGLKAGSLPLPIFVALREFEYACVNEPESYQRDLASLLRFLDDHFARSHPGRFPRDFLSGLVQSGRAWLLLDALDEVADFDHRVTVRQVIEKLASEFPANRLLVTARVAAYTGMNTRLDERFQVATVRDLTRDQWTPIVMRLYHGLEPNLQIAIDRGAVLRAKIDGVPMLQNMVKTPLMVWAATIIHYTKNDLPEQRAELYRAYVEVLLGERLHEEQQDAKAAQYLRDYDWPMGDRLLYLSYAAYQAHLGAETERGDRDRQAVVIVDEDDLVKHILTPYMIENRMLDGEKHQVRRQIQEEARKFVTFMAERSGLLCQVPEGGGYSFGDHLTVQEFLAARHLVDNVRGTSEWREFLQAHAGQGWWLETYLLMAGCLLEKSEQARRFLLDELGKLPGDGDAPAYGVAWAGRALLEIPSRRVGWYDSARDELARRLVRILWQNPPAASVAARAEAGDVLGRLGDPRFTGPCLLPEFIPITGGLFWMGSDEAEVARVVKETSQDWAKDEAPRHQVTLSPFALAKYPTTNVMFRRFVDAGGYADERWWPEAKAAKVWRPDGTVKDWFGDVRSQPRYWDDVRFNSPSQPVVGVTWYEAVAYCRWLTATLNDGCVYRLPTEAEWERAARGPASTRYPWADDWLAGRCNSKEFGLERTTPVGIFPDGGSPEGVLDLAGNVWEWCSDWYDEKEYQRRPDRATRDPAGPASGQYRVLRGGSWYNDRNLVRCACRDWIDPDHRNAFNGFRVARGSLR